MAFAFLLTESPKAHRICLLFPSFLESRPTIPNALRERIKWNFLARMLYLDFFFIN